MDISHGRATTTAPARARRLAIFGRGISGTAFACVVLAFLLPFGSVSSCGSSEEVRFTGMQLATAQVPRDAGTLHQDVEDNLSLLALATLAAALIGLGVTVAGRTGGGTCAAAGLVGLQLILWIGAASWDGFEVYEGFGCSLLAFTIAGLTQLVLAVRARRRAGRRGWTYALRSTALALSPTLALVALVLAAGIADA